METKTVKLKIHGIGPLQQSYSAKTTNRWYVLTVSEVPKNPYGHTLQERVPFEVIVYNRNIEDFGISEAIINEVGIFSLEILFKRNGGGPGSPLFVVTDLSFGI